MSNWRVFRHPRIRLIPSWQTLREDDYLRHYELATNQTELLAFTISPIGWAAIQISKVQKHI